MKKKTAVIIRKFRTEALRAAVGLSLSPGNETAVFFLDCKIEPSDESSVYIEALRELSAEMYSNVPQECCRHLDESLLARLLLEYDHIISF